MRIRIDSEDGSDKCIEPRNASAGGYDICGTRKVRDNHAILYSESGRCTVSSL